MIAIIQTGSKQYKVKANDRIKIEKIPGQINEEISFPEVLLVSDEEGKEVKLGKPFLKDAKVFAKILRQDKHKKIDVIKFKNKTRYRRKYGHRQPFTEVEILSITA